MRNQYTFQFSIDIVYQVIAQLVVDNANTFGNNNYSIADLASLDYEYDVTATRKMKVKVKEIVTNEKIVYLVNQTGLETYEVSFVLNKVDDSMTKLVYSYELINEKKSIQYNHRLIGFFYKRREKKKFNQMVQYLDAKCKELNH